MLPKLFKDHYQKFPKEQARALEKTAQQVLDLLKGSTMAMAWGMPTFYIGKDMVCHVEGFKNHNSYFPHSGEVIEACEKELAKYEVTKGAVHFDLDKPLSKALLTKMIRVRVDQINQSYPKKNGEYIQYHKNGHMKVSGKYKSGLEHGKWEWFCPGGLTMHTGEYKNGKKVGLWINYNKLGKITSQKQY